MDDFIGVEIKYVSASSVHLGEPGLQAVNLQKEQKLFSHRTVLEDVSVSDRSLNCLQRALNPLKRGISLQSKAIVKAVSSCKFENELIPG